MILWDTKSSKIYIILRQMISEPYSFFQSIVWQMLAFAERSRRTGTANQLELVPIEIVFLTNSYEFVGQKNPMNSFMGVCQHTSNLKD